MSAAGTRLYGQRRPWFLLALAAAVVLFVLPEVGLDRFWTREIVLIAAFAMATSHRCKYASRNSTRKSRPGHAAVASFPAER